MKKFETRVQYDDKNPEKTLPSVMFYDEVKEGSLSVCNHHAT